MQIQLKQPEIEQALKVFIAQQGINLTGKNITIEFTSGRKNNGLTADLVIEDVVIPNGTIEAAKAYSGTTTSVVVHEEPPEVPPNPEGEPVSKPVSLFTK
jgi:hypothetical protein